MRWQGNTLFSKSGSPLCYIRPTHKPGLKRLYVLRQFRCVVPTKDAKTVAMSILELEGLLDPERRL